MHGRSAAQPRVGTHKVAITSKTIKDINLIQILAGYSGTYRSISIPIGELNWLRDGTVIGADARTHSPPTQTLFSLLLHLDIYLYI